MEERAGFLIRFAAAVIDSIIVGIVQFIVTLVIGGGLDPEQANTGLSLIISFAIVFLYYVWFQTRNNGQTLGKKLTGIRVARLNGDRVSFGKMFLREIIGKTLSSITLLIGYLIALGKQKRALHDYLAGTVVLRTE